MNTTRKIGIILQARMNSTRLPGKILMDVGGMPLLLGIANRIKQLKSKVFFIIATSTEPTDDMVESFCKQEQLLCFRGSLDNVLSRYYECAKCYGLSDIIRMTGDNPFPDMDALEKLIKFHQKGNYDFSECFSVLPIGVGMEIFTFDAVEKSFFGATMLHHYEHVDEYILENPALFRCGTLPPCADTFFPALRATVDTLDDYLCANWISDKLGGVLSVKTSALVALLLKESVPNG